MRDHDHIMQFFAYEHLPPRLADVSRPFCELAKSITDPTSAVAIPRNPEAQVRVPGHHAEGVRHQRGWAGTSSGSGTYSPATTARTAASFASSNFRSAAVRSRGTPRSPRSPSERR